MLPPRKRTCSKLQIDLEMRKHDKSNSTGLVALCLPVPFQILLGFQAGSKWATLTVPEENKLHTASCGYKMMQYEVPQKILQCDIILRMAATCCNCTSLARVSFFQWFVQQLFAFCAFAFIWLFLCLRGTSWSLQRELHMPQRGLCWSRIFVIERLHLTGFFDSHTFFWNVWDISGTWGHLWSLSTQHRIVN